MQFFLFHFQQCTPRNISSLIIWDSVKGFEKLALTKLGASYAELFSVSANRYVQGAVMPGSRQLPTDCYITALFN